MLRIIDLAKLNAPERIAETYRNRKYVLSTLSMFQMIQYKCCLVRNSLRFWLITDCYRFAEI